MSESHDLEVQAIAVGTVGEPGRRRFFIQGRTELETVTLGCEKPQVSSLVERIDALLKAQGLDPLPGRPAVVQEPLEAEWLVAELGLGYHEQKERFVVVARELVTEPEGGPAAIARFWVRPGQLRGLARQAQGVLGAGRTACPRCGLPVDPAGHPCPAANGIRPIF